MDKKHRLAGIDLLKGVAAYAVVFIHSQSGEFGEPSYWTLQLSRLFGLAVPFFLATSFYLTINKIFSDHKPYSLTARLKFIIIPYLSWSLIYFLARCAKYLATGDILKIGDLFSNLLPMIFFREYSSSVVFLTTFNDRNYWYTI
ncbi:acyltransferase family protein [Nostoc sp. B(2019)]|nr:acyltransferase family protein [Nostoc sp. B(2019)]